MFTAPDLPLIIFTDLDGTLLDHDSYRYNEANEALSLIKKYRIPLIPVSSKTLEEITILIDKIGIQHPIIAENGAVMACPPDYFEDSLEDQWKIDTGGETYQRIIEVLLQMREDNQFAFTGFNDMSIKKIAELTGLEESSAADAKKRRASEPLLWQGSEVEMDDFEKNLLKRDLTLTRGGRFFHVMGKNTKGKAIRMLLNKYQQHQFSPSETIALGDSDNDLPMLEVANQAVVIRRFDNSHLHAAHIPGVYFTKNIGPAGWNEFITAKITDYAARYLNRENQGKKNG